MGVLALVAAAAAVVGQSEAVLRRGGCGADDEAVMRLASGTPVTPKFAFDGSCYKVTVTVDGRALDGFLPAAAIDGLSQYEQERRAARETAVAADAPRQASAPASLPAGHPAAELMRLFDTNQPAQALERIEGLIKTEGRHPRLLAMAGLAAYRGDDARRAIEYWKEALEKQPDPAVEQLLRRAEREARGDTSGGKKFGTRFVLRYDETAMESEAARGILAVLEEEFSRISYELGCRTEERIAAVIQPLDAFRRATDAAEWSGGLYDGRIRVAMLEAAPGALTRRVFAHEIVHACLARLGNYPAWLHEGLAQRLSGESLTPATQAAVRAAAHSGALPRLSRIGQDWQRMSAKHSAIAYGTALMAMDLYFQYHAALDIRTLLRSPDLLAGIETELDNRLRQ